MAMTATAAPVQSKIPGETSSSPATNSSDVHLEGSCKSGPGPDEQHLLLARFYQRTGFGRRLLAPCGCMPIFNILILVALATFFSLNAYNITMQYINSQQNPPTSIAVPDRAGELAMPSIVFCNNLSCDLPCKGRGALSKTLKIRYGDRNELVETTSAAFTYNGSVYECEKMDGGRLPVINTEGLYVGYLNVEADIGEPTPTNEYDLFMGINIFLYADATAPERLDKYPYPLSAAGYALLGGGVFTNVFLSLTKTVEYNSTTGTSLPPVFRYAVNSGTAALNPNLGGGRGGTTLSRVYAELSFQTTQVNEITQTPQTFSTFFGALAGWLGSCTDGWGFLTLLFVIEKLLMRLAGNRALRAQLWWVKPQNEVLDSVA